jgi:hypothetical protein
MLKKASNFVLASKKSSTYASGTFLICGLVGDHFEHPEDSFRT